jgi:hypothetical protein
MTTAAQSVSPSARTGQVAPDLQANGAAGYNLVPASCVLCGHDDAEPVAVGKDFTDPTKSETFLAVCCRTCGLVYLNPSPAPLEGEGTPPLEPAGQLPPDTDGWKIGGTVAREIARFAKHLPNYGRLLELVPRQGEWPDVARRCLGDNWHFDSEGIGRGDRITELNLPAAAYDAVILIGGLELANNPLATLKVIKSLLRPDGLVLVATPNTRSAACRLFRGRHWSGYNFPRHSNLFDGKSLGRAAGLAGLELMSVRTAPVATVWVESARNLMADWGAPAWVVKRLSQPSFLALAAANAIEWSQQIQSQGGLLVATLRRSPQ